MRGALQGDASSGSFVRHAFLAIVSLVALYPLWFIVTTALKTNTAYQLDPDRLPDAPEASASCVRSCSGPAAAPLDVEQLPRDRDLRSPRRPRSRCSRPTRSCSGGSGSPDLPLDERRADGGATRHAARAHVRVHGGSGWINHLQSVIVFYSGLLVPFAIFFLAGLLPHRPARAGRGGFGRGRRSLHGAAAGRVAPRRCRQLSRSSSCRRSGSGTSS